MQEQGKDGVSRKKKRRLIVGVSICLVTAVVILLDLYEYSTKTYVDLYTGILRSNAMLGVIPLPERYSTPEHAEWALQNMQDPAKRRWAWCASCDRNLLTGRGICADGEALDTVYAVYASALDPAEKLRYLKEWHEALDALPESVSVYEKLFESWRRKLDALPKKH